MMERQTFTFTKEERLCRRAVISRLFESGSRSFSHFPLRVVFMPVAREEQEPPVSILVSVPKKYFKRAVKRNRVKRQVRESYRKSKHILWEALEGKSFGLAVAFIWLDKTLYPSEEIESKMRLLLERIVEKTRAFS